MLNSDMPAMPCIEKIHPDVIAQAKASGGRIVHEITYAGLSKREHFAAMAMQGLLCSPTLNNGDGVTGLEISLLAVGAADALLKALDNA